MDAPSTPKPPALVTAATTSRQWLKATSGNSMPSMSQIGVFMSGLLVRLVGLPDRQSGQGAADDHALNLRRPFEYGEYFRVPVPALNRVVPGISVAAENLDGLLGHPHRGLACEQLGHRPLGLGELAAVPGHPGRPPGQQPE